MRRSRFLPAASLLLQLVVPGPDAVFAASTPGGVGEAGEPAGAQALYLEVFVNGKTTGMVAAVRREADGRLAMPVDQLRGVGIEPGTARSSRDGYIDVANLPNLAWRLDEATQSIHFDAADEARVRRRIGRPDAGKEVASLSSSVGGVVNYSLLANFANESMFAPPAYQGLSASFDTRLFSPLGVLQSTFVTTTSPGDVYDSTRLDTTWSWSDPRHMATYRAGDVITGGLGWTRPVRLGGFQVQRNFNLRPDLVTMPMPELSGSAAVPSTVEVYANNIRRFSGEVDSGPFEVANVPLAGGPGTVQIVVRDRFGRETVQEVPFYSSSRMLAPGLLDFSLDGGFARRDFGLSSDSYDDRFMAAGSLRYGLTRRMTLEGHLEAGEGLVSGGGAALFNIGAFGVASVNASASSADGRSGYRVGGSIEAAFGGWRLFASSQRTFGEFDDIASVTANVQSPGQLRQARVPKAVDQITLSAPAFRDGSIVNMNFANVEDSAGDRSSVVGLTYSRPFIGSSTLYANGYADVASSGSFGMFVGLSMPLGGGSLSSGVMSDASGTRIATDYVSPLDSEPWSVGWRVHDTEGDTAERLASVAMRMPAGRVEATVRQAGQGASLSAQMSGAVAVAGGGVFFSERINDAFAVVDVGAPDVDVRFQNRHVGKTNGSGKLMIPDLGSLRGSVIEIDPTNLPVDAQIPSTRQTVTPAEKSGVAVSFGVSRAAAAALVTLKRPDGSVVPVGAEGRLRGGESFVVGYDGQTYLNGLRADNIVEVDLPDTNETCSAAFAFRPEAGRQVALDNVVCQ